MRKFEYAVGEMVAHKHWRIVGKLLYQNRWKDHVGQEFHVYGVDFGKHTSELAQMRASYQMQCTEFELTKYHPPQTKMS